MIYLAIIDVAREVFIPLYRKASILILLLSFFCSFASAGIEDELKAAIESKDQHTTFALLTKCANDSKLAPLLLKYFPELPGWWPIKEQFAIWAFEHDRILASEAISKWLSYATPDAAMKSALLQNDSGRLEVLLKFFASDPEKWSVIDTYYKEIPNGLPAKQNFANWAFAKHKEGGYGPVVDWLRSSRAPAVAIRKALTDQAVTLVNTDPQMARVLAGEANRSSLVKTVKRDDVKIKQLTVALDLESFTLAKALMASKNLEGVTEVIYDASKTPVPLSGVTQLDYQKFADWVLGTPPHPELFAQLQEFSETLSSKTKPTRIDIADKMNSFATTREPGVAEQLREAMRAAMVRKQPVRYKGEDKSESRITLTLSLEDEADLRKARMLDHFKLLGDVEVINWNNVNERDQKPGYDRVNYPSINQIVLHKGENITGLIEKGPDDNPNFIPAKSGSGLWRAAKLLARSYIWHPVPHSCGAGTEAMNKATAQTTGSH